MENGAKVVQNVVPVGSATVFPYVSFDSLTMAGNKRLSFQEGEYALPAEPRL
jgi:hypothetical protein